MKKNNKILVASDFHYPFQKEMAVIQLEEYAEKFKPDYYIINGDLFDMMCFSSHRKSVINPKSEINIATQGISLHLRLMKKWCKNIVFLLGNHEKRLYKQLLSKAPEYEGLIKDDLFDFKGVKTIKDSHPELVIGDLLFMHGVSGRVGFHRDKAVMNTVIGHTHRPFIDYKSYRQGNLFEMNTGCMCDMNSEAFSYTLSKDRGWINSFGVIENGIPHIEIIK